MFGSSNETRTFFEWVFASLSIYKKQKSALCVPKRKMNLLKCNKWQTVSKERSHL